MRKFGLTAIAAIAVLVSFALSAFAETATTKCAKGEGQILEYDFPLGEDGAPILDSFYSVRLVSSNCVPGAASKRSFRGVEGSLRDVRDVERAVEAAAILISIGFTDAAAIKQLLDRVAPVKAARDARSKVVSGQPSTDPFLPFKDAKKK